MNFLQTSTIINNRYQLVEPLGIGGMGIVYRATDRLTGQEVALKQLTIPPKGVDICLSSQHNRPQAQEFRTLASLRHPHIVSVPDHGFDDQRIPLSPWICWSRLKTSSLPPKGSLWLAKSICSVALFCIVISNWETSWLYPYKIDHARLSSLLLAFPSFLILHPNLKASCFRSEKG